ncbi:MAG: hypothetical protein ACYDBJ_00845 [Aggregatilineales bacterium]
MSEPDILIQYVTVERTQHPTGRRVLADGTLQRTTADNPLPGPDDLLDRDRTLTWTTERRLPPDKIQAIKKAINEAGVFDLPPRLLINYCKEDPGVTIWTVSVDGHQTRIVLFDPKPKRSPELDRLLLALNLIWGA